MIVVGERVRKPRARQTVCKRGHSLIDDNVRLNKTTGHRACAECIRLRNRKWKAKHRIKKLHLPGVGGKTLCGFNLMVAATKRDVVNCGSCNSKAGYRKI